MSDPYSGDKRGYDEFHRCEMGRQCANTLATTGRRLATPALTGAARNV
jgi:hypothetical protein